MFDLKILVTAALPYANGPLHLGHIRSTYLPADIYSRYQRLAGNECLYICATDEHGTPIVVGAEKAGKKPKEFTDEYHLKDKKEFTALGFQFDIFHRTTSEENRKLTQHFFARLKEGGHIYTKEVEQPFCEKCSRFLPDRFIVGTCPHCKSERQYSDYCDSCSNTIGSGQLVNPQCITCGSVPSYRKSQHYFFKLASFSDKLRAYLTGNRFLQREVVNYVVNWIDGGLQDWDISRDLSWGVPIPGEPDKVFYVWFDAPIGYISSTMALRPDWEDFWKGDSTIVHFIGKDIIYHHFLFWPAMLMGVGEDFRAPDKMAVRGYLNLEHRKFSKSRGWFVSLEDYLKEFPADYLRYYQTAFTPHNVQDADFIWKDFQSKINNELVASIGNFVHRTLVLTEKLNGNTVPAPNDLDSEDRRLLGEITSSKEKIASLIAEFQLKEGQEEILRLCGEFNRFLSLREPWKEKDKAKVLRTLYVSLRFVSSLSILLEPYLPFTAGKLQKMLSVPREKVAWKNADAELVAPGAPLPKPVPLFEKISDEKIKAQEGRLQKNDPALTKP
ncbi:TPA: methionine--tRNA ligase [Candidatus Micrarchaeota archaeon]|nr:methionine--tRNA ligase [Candidatus Micrarchaeota archaeon]HIH30839.1 methionine--tRNA ligase [Candidatus Micrarchaeota archaeon]